MRISNTTTNPVRKNPAQTAPAPPKADDGGSFIRDAASLGAGIGGAVVGAGVGFGEGLIKGGIKNFPSHVISGAEIGEKIGSKAGLIAGGASTAITVPALAVTGVAGIVTYGALDILTETAVAAGKEAPSAVASGASSGAKKGSQIGSALGRVGEVTGFAVGGAIGGLAGLAVAVGRGVLAGAKHSVTATKEGWSDLKHFPEVAQETWKISLDAGKAVGEATVGTIGVAAGLSTATGVTLADGVIKSYERGSQFAKASSGFVSGESSSQEPTQTKPKEFT